MLASAGVAYAAEQEAKAGENATVRAKVALRDRSVLTGTPQFSELKLMTGSGEFQIPLPLVSTLSFTKGQVKVSFFNKDVLTGTLEGTALTFETSLGVLNLPCAQIDSVAFFKPGNTPHAPAGQGLLLHVPLDAPDANLDAFNAQMETRNAQVVEGPAGGKALLFDRLGAKATIHLPFSPYTMPEGTIEFWAKLPQPNLPFGDGKRQFSLFIIEQEGLEFCPLLLGFNTNTGDGSGGFAGILWGCPCAATHTHGTVSTVKETAVLGDTPDGWHHYAFIWKWDGLEFSEAQGLVLALAIDGNVVASASETPDSPYAHLRKKADVKSRFVIHDDNHFKSTYPLIMSGLNIWDYAKQPEPVKN